MFFLSKIHAQSAECGRFAQWINVKCKAFFPIWPKSPTTFLPCCLSNIDGMRAITGVNKMTWGSKKSLSFSLKKMQNTGHFVKIRLQLLLLCWFALNNGIVYQGPRLREDHSFGPWDHLLLSPSKNPIDLDTQHFFLVVLIIFATSACRERV